ncbi:hypothetical protein V8C42DRAFT_363473 [Trichoderma barbatum]
MDNSTQRDNFEMNEVEVSQYIQSLYSVEQSIEDARRATGLSIRCNPDWAHICSELDKLYGGPSQTIQFVTGAIKAWYKAIEELAKEESNSEWKREMLGKAQSGFLSMDLKINVKHSHDEGMPYTVWSDDHKGFLICIPAVKIWQDVSNCVHLFKAMLLFMFNKGKKLSGITNEITKGVHVPSTVSLFAAPQEEVYRIPNIETVKTPNELLSEPPYHLKNSERPTPHLHPVQSLSYPQVSRRLPP